MNRTDLTTRYVATPSLRIVVLVCICLSAEVTPVGIVVADPPQGKLVGWGTQVFGVDLSHGFIAVSAGVNHSLGLRSDGSIVGWGSGQLVVPAPNTGFVAVAAGYYHSLGLKADGSIVAWGDNASHQLDVPAPNTGFVAVAAGYFHSLGLKADGSIVGWGDNGRHQLEVPAPNSLLNKSSFSCGAAMAHVHGLHPFSDESDVAERCARL